MTGTMFLDFGDALKALKLGKTICRKAWDGTTITLCKTSSNIKEYPDAEDCIIANLWNGRRVSWIPMPDDLLAEDWIVKY